MRSQQSSQLLNTRFSPLGAVNGLTHADKNTVPLNHAQNSSRKPVLPLPNPVVYSLMSACPHSSEKVAPP